MERATHMVYTTRQAEARDASAIARIYNEGIADRVATFETRERTSEEITGWLNGGHPVVVVESPDAGSVVGFAATFPYRARDCYQGIAEFSVYVARHARGCGAGRAALTALIAAAEASGFWKLVSRVFPENTASRTLLAALGFREVGVYRKHAKLDGVWRDALIVERLLDANRR
jgi:phosphinothricin acetyltransferase